jgi:hypothetical protein
VFNVASHVDASAVKHPEAVSRLDPGTLPYALAGVAVRLVTVHVVDVLELEIAAWQLSVATKPVLPCVAA